MFLVQKSKIGVSTEYLSNAEEKHNEYSVAFDSPKIEQFLKEKNINSSSLSPEIYSQYLEQQNNHYKARFIGELSKEWNLKEYNKKTFTDLMNNKLPNGVRLPIGINIKSNGNIITQKAKAQTGIDTVSNAPKSVSIEFARSSKDKQDKLVKAMNTTTEQIFEKIANQIKPSCKTHSYQDFKKGSCKLLITSFTHYENRGYEEDGIRRLEPNLHTHNSVKNFAEFEIYKHDKDGNRILDKDGEFLTEKRMLAIDPEEVFKRQLENSAQFDTLLNSNLQKEGFKTEQADEQGQTFRLVGYTDGIEISLSHRRQEILAFIQKQKDNGLIFSSEQQAEIEYTKTVRQQTAHSKELHKADDILKNISDTVTLNITKEQQDEIDFQQKNKVQEFKEPDLKQIMKSQAFETDGIIEETKLKTEIYKQVRFSQTFNSIEDLDKKVSETFDKLKNNEFMKDKQLIQMNDGRYTRLDIALNEKALENNINILKGFEKQNTNIEIQDGRKFVADFYKERANTGFEMNSGQVNSLKLAVKLKPISMVIGDAGTGKTTSFIYGSNALHESLGRKVFGISVGTSTSKDLVDGKIKAENCLNTKQFLNKAFIINKETGQASNKLNMKFVKENLNSTIIFDEAGMCGSEDMKKITDFVKEARNLGGDTQLILVGDHKQLSSVSYGNAFLNIQKQLDNDSFVRLEENTRQRNDIAKDIAEGYRDKNPIKVFKTLEENNLLITDKKQDKVNERLVEDYLNDKNKSKLIVCGLNTEIDQINDMVRSGLFKQEKLKPVEERTIAFDKSVSIEVSRKSGLNTLERERTFCPGEEIVFLQNATKKQVQEGLIVENSQRGIIKNIEPIKGEDNNFKITVDIKGNEVSFETKEYNKFNHCYAVSTHKSQGKTVDNTYHLGNANLARYQNCYVNGSRHKEQYKLYLAEDQVEKYKLNSVKEIIKETTLNDINCQKAVEEYVFNSVYQEAKKLQPMPEFMVKQLNQNAELEQSKEISNKFTEKSKIAYKQALENQNASKLAMEKIVAERTIKFKKEFEQFEPKEKVETIVQAVKLNEFNTFKKNFIEKGLTMTIDKLKEKTEELIEYKQQIEVDKVFVEIHSKFGFSLNKELLAISIKERWNNEEHFKKFNSNDVYKIYKSKSFENQEENKLKALMSKRDGGVKNITQTNRIAGSISTPSLTSEQQRYANELNQKLSISPKARHRSISI